MKKVTSYKLRVTRYILTVLRSYGLMLFLLSAFSFFPSALHAQWFLGGGVGFNLNIEKTKYSSEVEAFNKTYKQTYVGFALIPKFGYYCTEKFALGLNCSAGYNFSVLNKLKNYGILWSVNPFVRFTTFTYKNFSLILEGGSSVGALHPSWKYRDEIIEKEHPVLAIGVFNITPILGFKLTEHLQLEAEVNFLSIGYNIDITRHELNSMTEGEFTMKEVTHSFNIGLNSKSILSTTQIRVGVIYKFNKKGDKL